MVQRTHTSLTDDVDGSEAAETVRFALDGVGYEIDLTEEHARELREALELFVRAARRVRGSGAGSSSAGSADRPRSAGSPATRRDPAQTKAIRAWAAANGHAVSERGRIAESVVAAYDAAH